MMKMLRNLTLTITTLIGLYALIGFFVVAPLLRPQVEEMVSKNLTGVFTIGKIEFHPFFFATTISDIALKSDTDESVIQIDGLTLDFTPAELISGQAVIDSLELTGINIQDPLSKKSMVHVPELSLQGLSFSWNSNSLIVDHLELDTGVLQLVLDRNGQLNLVRVIESLLPTNSEERAPNEEGTPFALTAHSLHLRDHSVVFVNEYGETHGSWSVENLDFQVADFSLDKNKRSQVKLSFSEKRGGSVEVDGSLLVEPFSFVLDVTLQKFSLEEVSPLLRTIGMRVGQGKLSSQLDVQMSQEQEFQLGATGDVSLLEPQLHLENQEEPVFQSSAVNLSNLDFELTPLSVRASALSLDKPIVHLKGSSAGNNAEERESENEELPNVVLESLIINDGSFTYLDPSPGKSVSHSVSAIELKAGKIALAQDELTPLELTAQIDGSAPLSVNGEFIPKSISRNMKADLSVERFSLNKLSPYSERFLGRKLSGGKLSAKLSTKLQGDLVRGQNKIVFHRLVFGDSVKSSDAVDVPIETVFSIMRDSAGDVVFDIPIEGNSSDPSFRYMTLLGETFLKTIFEVATSPLSLLSSVYDWAGGSLEVVEFDFQSGELVADQQQKLDVIVKALLEKSDLELEIHGGSSQAEFGDNVALEKLEELSNTRAQAIEEYLVSKGVPGSRLFVSEIDRSSRVNKGRVQSHLDLHIAG